MECLPVEWQKISAQVVNRFKAVAGRAEMHISSEARGTITTLLSIRSVEVVDDIPGDAAFVFDQKIRHLKINRRGLERIYLMGTKRDFDGMDPVDFCEVAFSLYFFHEAHHISQRLIEFEDVQAMKRTAGEDKLGEIDLLADTVAAQLFAAIETENAFEGREFYCAAFVSALNFMVSYCFPAFGFSLEKKHKVQRALGIVLMAMRGQRAIQSGQLQNDFDLAIYPFFSKDFTEMMLMGLGGTPSMSVVRVYKALRPESTKALLEILDSGDIEAIQKAAKLLA
ncbi:hypothetical protein LB535_23200 [Mesorhizobium sp. CA10]|uniref:hypothetical protein n=1 Tax=Mesorhizobium sp. CA10 TaxID=588495 RepID=UPI001CD00A60|nr:hypothetical protein [Mesorhizobium sp. CA10]MBZ9885247.1 hypothetical protein [Mesorhizobium sp. CA10]